VLLWCAKEPGRIGEALLFNDSRDGGGPSIFGRGATLVRPRPGSDEPTAPLVDPFV